MYIYSIVKFSSQKSLKIDILEVTILFNIKINIYIFQYPSLKHFSVSTVPELWTGRLKIKFWCLTREDFLFSTAPMSVLGNHTSSYSISNGCSCPRGVKLTMHLHLLKSCTTSTPPQMSPVQTWISRGITQQWLWTFLLLSACLATYLYDWRSGSDRNSLWSVPSVIYLMTVRSEVQSSNLIL